MLFPFKQKTFNKKDCIAGFGKLPVHAEFISYRVTEPRMIDLDHWYRKAYSTFSQTYGVLESKSLLAKMPTYHFLFSDSIQPMIGSVFAGVDAGGRCYPFVLARILENPLSREFMTAIPLLYQDYFREANVFFERASHYRNLKEVHHAIDKMAEISPGNHKKEVLEHVLTVLKTTLFSDYGRDLGVSIDVIFSNLFYLLRDRSSGSIRLPLPDCSDLLPFVVFFLQFFESVLDLSSFNWQVYWQKAGENRLAEILFVFEPLDSNDWDCFLTKNTKASDVYGLENIIPADQGINQSSSLYEAIQIFAHRFIIYAYQK